MKERGRIIRHELPDLLRGYLPDFRTDVGRFAEDLSIEGSDGMGRKTEAPWVRLYSESLSPSATTGFYVVIHFALDGETFFVTIGCGATRWDSDRGHFRKHSAEEVERKVGWANDVLTAAGKDTSDFPDEIALGATRPLPKAFEKATVLAKALDPGTVVIDEFISTVRAALKLLAVIYEAYDQLPDLSFSETVEIDKEPTAANSARLTARPIAKRSDRDSRREGLPTTRDTVTQPMLATVQALRAVKDQSKQAAAMALAEDDFQRAQELSKLAEMVTGLLSDLEGLRGRWDELADRAAELGLIQVAASTADGDGADEPPAAADDVEGRHCEITDSVTRTRTTAAALDAFAVRYNVDELSRLGRGHTVYSSVNGQVGVTVMFSKFYPDGDCYWYGLHKKQLQRLAGFPKVYHLFVLGSDGRAACIERDVLAKELDNLPTTQREENDDFYWHIKLRFRGDRVDLLRKSMPPIQNVVVVLPLVLDESS
jgi:hypothetical protein